MVDLPWDFKYSSRTSNTSPINFCPTLPDLISFKLFWLGLRFKYLFGFKEIPALELLFSKHLCVSQILFKWFTCFYKVVIISCISQFWGLWTFCEAEKGLRFLETKFWWVLVGIARGLCLFMYLILIYNDLIIIKLKNNG